VLRVVVLVSVVIVVGTTPLPLRGDRLIYDTARVIDDAVELQLEPRLHELAAKTGVAIVVVTVPKLVDETIGQLAVRTGQTWGVGKRGQDRGLVVAVARDDRKIFVTTGYGTESYLTDGRVGSLLERHAVPLLRQDRFSDGITQLVDALVAASAQEYDVTISGMPPPTTGRGPWQIVFVIFSMLVVLLLAVRFPALALGVFGGRIRGRGFGGGFGSGGLGGGGFGGGGAGRGF
jgi:uncharacterized protein